MNYVQSHYREAITLEDLAAETFLSRTYLSRCFTRYFGIPFTDYVTLLRLSDATKRMHGEDTLADIAYASGFPNVNSMIHAFRQHRGITPGEYRRQLLQNRDAAQPARDGTDDSAREDFSSLMNYTRKTAETGTAAEHITSITVDVHGRKKRISLHWKRMINAGYAKDLTNPVIQHELRYLQEHIGFEYIRIKGILDDDMCLLRADMNGAPVMNYVYVDEVIDFICSLGARPMIELGYMPYILAKEPMVHSMRAAIFSVPKDIDGWQRLIRSLMEHLVERFGSGPVSKWLFAPWLLPDLMAFGLCTPEEYEEIYLASYSAIRQVLPDALTTGPGCSDPRALSWYIAMCRRRQCLPDIFTFRCYATAGADEKDELNLIRNNESFPMAVSADENRLHSLVTELKTLLAAEGPAPFPLVLEEWNSNIWQRDLCNDTCYKSAYLFKNILENNQDLSAMGYFSVNDRLDEIPPSREIFHGGFGLFTQNDIPKSACRALELLGRMGTHLLQQGDGYCITRSDQGIQIFLYNYCHYDLLYRYRHVVHMSRSDRYEVFVSKKPQAFYIRFEHMDAGTYEIRRYGITKDGGSSYDAWVKMGAPESPDTEETELLRHLSHPLYRREYTDVCAEDHVLTIRTSLNPLDVWLIRIKIP